MLAPKVSVDLRQVSFTLAALGFVALQASVAFRAVGGLAAVMADLGLTIRLAVVVRIRSSSTSATLESARTLAAATTALECVRGSSNFRE